MAGEIKKARLPFLLGFFRVLSGGHMRSRGSKVDNGWFGDFADDFMDGCAAHGAGAPFVGWAGPDGRPDAGFAEFVAAIDLRNLGGRHFRQADGAFEGFVECGVPDGLCDKMVGGCRLPLGHCGCRNRRAAAVVDESEPSANGVIVNVLGEMLRFVGADANQRAEILEFGGEGHRRILFDLGEILGV